jgi:hypothetical protein
MFDVIIEYIRNNEYGLLVRYLNLNPKPLITENHLWVAKAYNHEDMFELLKSEKIRQTRLEKLKLLDKNV